MPLLLLLIAVAAPLAGAQEEEEPPPPAGGPSEVVVAIEVVGNERHGADQLRSVLGQVVGEPLDEEAISRGIDELWRTFRVRAAVDARPVDGGLELVLIVQEMELDFEPRFIGNDSISDKELREWARLEPGGEIYLYQAPRVRQRLLDGYRREGFHFAQVRSVSREGRMEDGRWLAPDLIFEIIEGPRAYVAGVVLHGNESMPSRGFWFWRSGLKKFANLQLRGPRFLGLFKSKFVEELLERDLEAMRQVYRDRGWLDAVVALDRLEFDDDRNRVRIHVLIDEGPRYRVGSVAVEAVERVPSPDRPGDVLERPAELLFGEEDLLSRVELDAGDFFEARIVQRDERTLRSFYGEHGYIDHLTIPAPERWEFLEPALVLDEDEPLIHVVYRIAQGRQQFIREVRVTGITHTRDRVVRDRITVDPGEVADLEEIERSRARIRRLGFFSDVRPGVQHAEPRYRFVETDDPAWKDLEYVVEESSALSFQVSGGVTSNQGIFGIFEVRKSNFDLFDPPSSLTSAIPEIARGEAFHGAGQELLLRASPGTEVTRFNVIFREPDVFRLHRGRRIGLDVEAAARFRRFDSHDEERREFGFRLRRDLGPDAYVALGPTFGRVEIDDLDSGGEPTLGDPLPVPTLLKEQEGKSDIGYLDFRFVFSDLDHPFAPQRGSRLDVGSDVFTDLLGSDFDFVRTTARWRRFGQFGERSPDAKPGWMVELQAGVSVPYGGDDDVPYSERFFLGGSGSRGLRGFDFRGVGPHEKGFPIGGETMFAGTLEYRHPLIKSVQPGTFHEVEVVRGGLFLDWGVLDPDPGEIDLDETRASVGFLVGLAVPLPLTLAFGFPIREKDGDDTQLVSFSLTGSF